MLLPFLYVCKTCLSASALGSWNNDLLDAVKCVMFLAGQTKDVYALFFFHSCVQSMQYLLYSCTCLTVENRFLYKGF